MGHDKKQIKDLTKTLGDFTTVSNNLPLRVCHLCTLRIQIKGLALIPVNSDDNKEEDRGSGDNTVDELEDDIEHHE